MPETFAVRLEKAEHVFSAAHFITFDGTCEPLHGHNYHVAVQLHGHLHGDGLVIDFIRVRDLLREILTELDHVTLLPTKHDEIRVIEDGDYVKVEYADRHWVFPSDNCRLLPIANTTTELLAAYIGGRMLAELVTRAGWTAGNLRVELDECDGQLAIWEHFKG